MSVQAITKTFQMADGRTISIETGKLAKQSDGSAVVKMGNTVLLATVVAAKDAKDDVDFLPLSVDYKEKYAATGKFPGGFFKREGRPSEYEILISRLVDRALRPLFPDDFHAEVQVIIQLLSGGNDDAPDALAALAASAALSVSDIPFNGPISEVRVALIDGEYVINPTISKTETADLELIVAGSDDNILMVEGELKEVSEKVMLDAIKAAHEAIKVQCQAQKELGEMVEKAKVKREYSHERNDDELREKVKAATYSACYKVALEGNADKHARGEAFTAIREGFMETLSEEEKAEKETLVKRYFHDVEKEAVRNAILDERVRLDGRKLDQVRPIWSEVDYLPSTHGSAIFTRGETQSLVTVTLGNRMNEQTIDGAVIEGSSKFILHYNFPGFSTGEVRRFGSPGRREIGHGNLAMRALKYVIPEGEENPYTIRVVSDILESNGSSSMATVCGGTLALMDAGVKITKPVAGIAMGLITNTQSGKYAVLSDILGDEDHLGDMDFKVTGTADGITACQMDIKVDGLSYEVLEKALEQARQGRIHILGEMAKTITEPRADYKDFVPRIERVTIPKEFIGAVIGPGGKVIQEMQKETNTVIVIEEVGNLGVIDISSPDKASIEAAKAKIKGIVAVPEVGEIYHGTVKSIVPFGAFVEVLPGKEGLLHISEIEWRRLEKVEEVLKEGDKIDVKLIGIDERSGKMKLSRKVLLERPEKTEKKN
ncbi:MAG: polyribonucleotide nucleotidyltransferase [Bacteroidales bacterium]|nr:polyribonucleotide nucleotidyltransferase [Bacteroidales bacterium]